MITKVLLGSSGVRYIVLATADGFGMGKLKRSVWRWQERYIEEGVYGLWRDNKRHLMAWSRVCLPLSLAQNLMPSCVCTFILCDSLFASGFFTRHRDALADACSLGRSL